MEKLTEKRILDYGIVSLLEVMGSDKTIAESARISYNTNSTKQTSTDEQLIRYLVRHKHTSPLEMGVVRFYLKLPIFVARQLIRHRTASLNEVSARYSELPNEMYVPEPEQCGPNSTTNKQGRSTDFGDGIVNQGIIRSTVVWIYSKYKELLESTSKEISRIVLPVATYTEMVWSCDVHNFLHFCKLRLDPHAQYEIRVFAQAMYDSAQPFFPITFQAHNDYIRNAHTLSVGEQQLLAECIKMGQFNPSIDDAKRHNMSTREHAEFTTWLSTLIK
jgi:thymidylate synthase (FAD)